ncbi:MAG: ankyrin repeat domain-containing protein, partial [Alphaproteobacteria bacterium]|nr:ankyrin repeat domain-containing protein [Alphaproteobacteria bacterium]
MKNIMFGVLLALEAFTGEVRAFDLEAMTVEKYNKIQDIRKQSNVDLIAAVQRGDDQRVQALLEEGADVNQRDGAENTALLAAVKGGYKNIAEILLKNGADVNARMADLSYSVGYYNGREETKFYQSKGLTPLMSALAAGRGDMVELLLENGADTELRDVHEMTALMMAAERKDVSIIKTLLDFGADITARGKYGDSLISYALTGIDDVAKYKIFADLQDGKAGLAQLMVLGDDGFEMLAEKNKREALEMTEMLIEAGADVNERDDFGRTPLMEACKRADVTAVEFLLAHGALINLQDKEQKTALMYAAEYAGRESNLQIIKMLLAKGADVNIENALGETALMIASQTEEGEAAIKLLLNKGADINKQAVRGGGALHDAYNFADNIYGDKNTFDVLLEAGADINQGDNQGRTVLMEAVQNNDLAMVRKLLEKGADVNQQTTDFWGGTALMIAAEKGNEDIVRLLLQAGA